MGLPTIFDTCRPRADVLAGTIRDDEFMADLSRALLNALPPGIASAGKKKPDANLAGAGNAFEALERPRKLAFSETAPAPKIPEQRLLPLGQGERDGEEDE